MQKRRDIWSGLFDPYAQGRSDSVADTARSLAANDNGATLIAESKRIERDLATVADQLLRLPPDRSKWPAGWRAWPAPVIGSIKVRGYPLGVKQPLSEAEMSRADALLRLLGLVPVPDQQLIWMVAMGQFSFRQVARVAESRMHGKRSLGSIQDDHRAALIRVAAELLSRKK